MKYFIIFLLAQAAYADFFSGPHGDGKFLANPQYATLSPCAAGEYNSLVIQSGVLQNWDETTYTTQCQTCNKTVFHADYSAVISGAQLAGLDREECCFNSDNIVCIEQRRAYEEGCHAADLTCEIKRLNKVCVGDADCPSGSLCLDTSTPWSACPSGSQSCVCQSYSNEPAVQLGDTCTQSGGECSRQGTDVYTCVDKSGPWKTCDDSNPCVCDDFGNEPIPSSGDACTTNTECTSVGNPTTLECLDGSSESCAGAGCTCQELPQYTLKKWDEDNSIDYDRCENVAPQNSDINLSQNIHCSGYTSAETCSLLDSNAEETCFWHDNACFLKNQFYYAYYSTWSFTTPQSCLDGMLASNPFDGKIVSTIGFVQFRYNDNLCIVHTMDKDTCVIGKFGTDEDYGYELWVVEAAGGGGNGCTGLNSGLCASMGCTWDGSQCS
jgi:hypothetical protein